MEREIEMLSIESNQAGYNPCFTYYYIVNEKGETYHHKDKKWRKKSLMEITTYYFLNLIDANKTLEILTIKKPLFLTENTKKLLGEII